MRIAIGYKRTMSQELRNAIGGNWRWIAALLVVAGCHREAARSSAEADALWALAPDGTTVGFVATPRAITMTEHALQDIRKFLAAAPELAPLKEELDQALADAKLGSGTLADLGMAPGKGMATFAAGDDQISILPVVDRDKFVAFAKGTKGSDSDTIDKATCKTVRGFYACTQNAALFDRLGKGKVVDKLASMRGDVELVIDEPNLLGNSKIIAVAQLERGAVVVRGTVTHIAPEITKMLGAPAKPRTDADRSAGFGVIDVRGFFKDMPDLPLVAGVTTQQLAKSIAGPLTLDIPAGVSVFDARVALTDPAPAKTLVEHCTEIPALAAMGAKIVDGACHFTMPNLNADGDLWVDGTTLRFGKKSHVAGTPVEMTALGKELAGGEWTAAVWGRGTIIAPGELPPQMALPPEIGQVVRAFAMFDESGFGIRIDGDNMKFVFGLRTAWSNPDDVVAKITAIKPDDVLAGKAGDAGKAIAAAAPDSPFASDYKAGYQGLMMPVAAIGIVAAVAIPAFTSYMLRSKQSPADERLEAELQLTKIGKNLKMYYMQNVAFPKGDVIAPATCCGQPGNLCRQSWQDAVWRALEFSIDVPARYRYGYHSDGKTATVTAIGDLDCDGTDSTWELHASGEKGDAKIDLVPPANRAF